MKRKPKIVLPAKYILLILTVVCVAAMITSFTLNISGGPLNAVAGYVFVPMQRGINTVGAWITEKAGLSMELGAFIVGMLISETRYKNEVDVDIKSFRDVLLGLFFITIGMMVFTYSISYGIGLGLISYVLIQIFTGKFCKTEKTVTKEDGTEEVVCERSYTDIVTAVIGLFFAVMFFLTH